MSRIGEWILLRMSRSPGTGDYPESEESWNSTSALQLLRREFHRLDGFIQGSRVVDYGCGAGWQALAMAQTGAAFVLGLDIRESLLESARSLVSAHGLDGRVQFRTRSTAADVASFDLAVSQNSFEHFYDPAAALEDMARLLKPGGRVLLTFGPPWLAPYGSHTHFFTRVPWVNVLFRERTVMAVRSRFRSDGAARYEEVEGGLNRMTLSRLEQLLTDSRLEVESRRYKCVKGLPLGRIPGIREFAVNHVTCVLRKPSDC